MTPLLKKRLLKYSGYSAFFGLAFLVMLYLTFPYRQLANWVVKEARKNDFGLTIGSLGPSFPGLKATKVELRLPEAVGGTAGSSTGSSRMPRPAMARGPAGGAGAPDAASAAAGAGAKEATSEAIPIDSVKVWPGFLSVKYEARLFGGTVRGSVSLTGRRHVVVRSKGLDLGRANSKASMGLDLAGKLDTDIDLTLDTDGTKTTGKFGLFGTGLVINGGTVAQYDLPKVEIGQLDMTIKLEGGKGTVERFKAQGADVEAALEGEIALAQKILLSNLRLKLKFKPAEDWLKRNSFIQTGLNFAMSKDARGFYTVNVNRVLGNPGFQPQR